MSAAPRISDAQLLATDFATDDPENVEGLSTLPPPEFESAPKVLFEYHLGRDRLPVRCCYCPSKTPHSNGFVIEAEDGARHLIGSRCGPKHLGVHFGTARSSFQADRNRKALLLRVASLRADLRPLAEYGNEATLAQPLCTAHNLIQHACPKLYQRLRDLAAKDENFWEEVRLRDTVREQAQNSEGPLWTTARRPIGPFKGAGLMRANSYANALTAWPRAIVVFLRDTSGTEVPDKTLKDALTAVKLANERARAAASVLSAAHEFFDEDNLERLARWQTLQTEKIVLGKPGTFMAHGPNGIKKGHLPAPTAFAAPPPI